MSDERKHFMLSGRKRPFNDTDETFTFGREPDELGTPVCFMRCSFDKAHLFALVYQLAHGLFRHLGAYSQLRDARAFKIEIPWDVEMGHAQPGKAVLIDVIEDARVEQPVGGVEQTAHVVSTPGCVRGKPDRRFAALLGHYDKRFGC